MTKKKTKLTKDQKNGMIIFIIIIGLILFANPGSMFRPLSSVADVTGAWIIESFSVIDNQNSVIVNSIADNQLVRSVQDNCGANDFTRDIVKITTESNPFETDISNLQRGEFTGKITSFSGSAGTCDGGIAGAEVEFFPETSKAVCRFLDDRLKCTYFLDVEIQRDGKPIHGVLAEWRSLRAEVEILKEGIKCTETQLQNCQEKDTCSEVIYYMIEEEQCIIKTDPCMPIDSFPSVQSCNFALGNNNGEEDGEEDNKINVYRFENNQCSLITINENEILSNDYLSLLECQDKIISDGEKDTGQDTEEDSREINTFIILIFFLMVGIIGFFILKKNGKKKSR